MLPAGFAVGAWVSVTAAQRLISQASGKLYTKAVKHTRIEVWGEPRSQHCPFGCVSPASWPLAGWPGASRASSGHAIGSASPGNRPDSTALLSSLWEGTAPAVCGHSLVLNARIRDLCHLELHARQTTTCPSCQLLHRPGKGRSEVAATTAPVADLHEFVGLSAWALVDDGSAVAECRLRDGPAWQLLGLGRLARLIAANLPALLAELQRGNLPLYMDR